MGKAFDYGGFFGVIEPLADLLRESETRVWHSAPGKHPPKAEFVLYLGCNVLRTVALAETVVAVLKSMGVDFVALGGPANCCGVVHHRNGDAEDAKTIAAHTFRNFLAVQPKGVLVYCPSCHGRMPEIVPPGAEGALPYQHVTKFLAENLERVKFTTPVNRRVALHGHNGGGQAALDLEATRRILAAVPGLELVVLEGGEEWGPHCYPGQINKAGRPHFDRMVDGMFETVRARGAGALTTVYHSCYRELCPREGDTGVEVINYIQLVAEGMGIGLPAERFKTYKIAADPAAACAALAPTAERRGLGPGKVRRTLDYHFKKA